jgi:hypothetical protein
MRRAIAISLMMLFSWMLIAPLLASDADANLPACCRRNGKHHCMMRRMMQLSGAQRSFTAVSEKCPYRTASVCVSNSPTYEPEAAGVFCARTVFHPVRARQTVAHYRLSFLRGHQRRGPPTSLA